MTQSIINFCITNITDEIAQADNALQALKREIRTYEYENPNNKYPDVVVAITEAQTDLCAVIDKLRMLQQ